MADRILVLENGRILESGSHDQLLALAGRYSELFELQAAGYR
jgi:ATP-binding cassette subfamily B protein